MTRLAYWWGKPRGTTREVFLVGELAIKIPSLRSWSRFVTGVRCNLQEAEFSALSWSELCPVVASFGGFVLVMRRAVPLSEAEWVGFDPERFCTRAGGEVLPVEIRRCSFGTLGGRIVAVDYGS